MSNPETDWMWGSEMMEHRQRHPLGQMEIREMIRTHLPFPQDYNSTEAYPYMLYMAQIVQSHAQKTESEKYRRMVDKLNDEGIGHNMGALYWQLNDIWPGASWASIGKIKTGIFYACLYIE